MQTVYLGLALLSVVLHNVRASASDSTRVVLHRRGGTGSCMNQITDGGGVYVYDLEDKFTYRILYADGQCGEEFTYDFKNPKVDPNDHSTDLHDILYCVQSKVDLDLGMTIVSKRWTCVFNIAAWPKSVRTHCVPNDKGPGQSYMSCGHPVERDYSCGNARLSTPKLNPGARSIVTYYIYKDATFRMIDANKSPENEINHFLALKCAIGPEAPLKNDGPHAFYVCASGDSFDADPCIKKVCTFQLQGTEYKYFMPYCGQVLAKQTVLQRQCMEDRYVLPDPSQPATINNDHNPVFYYFLGNMRRAYKVHPDNEPLPEPLYCMKGPVPGSGASAEKNNWICSHDLSFWDACLQVVCLVTHNGKNIQVLCDIEPGDKNRLDGRCPEYKIPMEVYDLEAFEYFLPDWDAVDTAIAGSTNKTFIESLACALTLRPDEFHLPGARKGTWKCFENFKDFPSCVTQYCTFRQVPMPGNQFHFGYTVSCNNLLENVYNATCAGGRFITPLNSLAPLKSLVYRTGDVRRRTTTLDAQNAPLPSMLYCVQYANPNGQDSDGATWYCSSDATRGLDTCLGRVCTFYQGDEVYQPICGQVIYNMLDEKSPCNQGRYLVPSVSPPARDDFAFYSIENKKVMQMKTMKEDWQDHYCVFTTSDGGNQGPRDLWLCALSLEAFTKDHGDCFNHYCLVSRRITPERYQVFAPDCSYEIQH